MNVMKLWGAIAAVAIAVIPLTASEAANTAATTRAALESATPMLYKTPAGEFRAHFPATPTIRRTSHKTQVPAVLGPLVLSPSYIVSCATWHASVEVSRLATGASSRVVALLARRLNFYFSKRGSSWVAPSGVTTVPTTLLGYLVVTPTSLYTVEVVAPTMRDSRIFVASFSAPGLRSI